MTGRNSKLYSFILILVDALVLVAAFVIAYIARVQYDPRPLLHNIYAYDYLFAFLLIVPFWIMIFGLIGLYQTKTYQRRLLEWGKIAVGSFLGLLLIIGWEYVSDKDLFPARLVAVYALVASFVLIVLEREVMRLIRSLSFRYGRNVKRVLLIGSSAVVPDIAKNLADTTRSGYVVTAVATPKNIFKNLETALAHNPESAVFGQIQHFSTPEAALKNIEELKISAIIQTDLYENTARNQLILSTAQQNHIDYSFIPGETEFYSGKNTVDVFLGYPMITVYQTPLIGWGSIVKRIFDFAVSLVLVIILSPLFLIIAILQKILNPGTIFYKNERLSRFSKPVNLLKFRSMHHLPQFEGLSRVDDAAEFRAMGREDLAKEYEKNQKVSNDPRVNSFGRLLRRTSIDELPGIINVLKGDLSLVGPRPILKSEMHLVRGKASILHSVKSGVTGLWQVSGRSDLSFDDRIELEVFYAQNWTFWLDIKILIKTAWVVVRGKGAK